MHTRTTAAAASSLGQEMSRIDSRTKRRFPQGKCHSVEKCEKSERRRKNGAEQKIRTERDVLPFRLRFSPMITGRSGAWKIILLSTKLGTADEGISWSFSGSA